VIERGHVVHLLFSSRVGLAIEPIATEMGLELGLLLKNARRGGLKWWSQCPA
jgi:hypothetical protein